MKFIDAIGLKYFYDKLKDKFVQKSAKVSKENIDIYGITSYADLYKMFVSIGDENVPAIIAADNTSSPKYFIMSMYNNTPSDEDNGLHVNKCCIMQICSNTEDGKIKSLGFKDDGIFTMTDNVVGKNTELFAANGTLFDITTKADAFTEIPSSSWKTSTPFNILDGLVTNIYKGETVGNYTKWILIPYADSENQKYTAYKKGNAKYIYSQYDFDPNQPLLPWEFWLPSNLTSGTVEVDW